MIDCSFEISCLGFSLLHATSLREDLQKSAWGLESTKSMVGSAHRTVACKLCNLNLKP